MLSIRETERPTGNKSKWGGLSGLLFFLADGLDSTLCFCNYRTMEQHHPSDGIATLPCCGHALQNVIYRRDSSFVDSVLTDAVLSELKKQSANGCLLCSLDAWEGEEWD